MRGGELGKSKFNVLLKLINTIINNDLYFLTFLSILCPPLFLPLPPNLQMRKLSFDREEILMHYVLVHIIE